MASESSGTDFSDRLIKFYANIIIVSSYSFAL
jgi:hypothetical protein